MRLMKHTVIALTMAGMLSTQAYATEAAIDLAAAPAQTAAFTDADMAALFDNANQPMQLAALSGLEMKETEGAFNALGAVAGGLWGGGSAIMYHIGQGKPISAWNWGSIGVAAALGAMNGGFAYLGPAARYAIPRVTLVTSFVAGRKGW